MRILILSNSLPYPPNAGTAIREYQLLKRIAREHEIWLLTFENEKTDGENARYIKEFCKEVVLIPRHHHGATSKPFEFLQYLLNGIPPDLRLYYEPQMDEKIHDLLSQETFDIFQIDGSYLGFYVQSVPEKIKTKLLVSVIDIVYQKYDRIYRVEKKPGRKLRLWLHSRMMRKWEPEILNKFDCSLVMSNLDKAILERINPQLKIFTIPNGMEATQNEMMPVTTKNWSLLFVGNMDYRPNIDAMVYFCGEVFPELQKSIKDIELWIVGRGPGDEIWALQKPNIHVTGEVADVKPFYKESLLCVVPLRAGGGTRLKILEAMAYGRPVISTSIGCEGLDVIDGENLLIANTTEEFYQKVQLLISDGELRNKLIRNGRDLVLEKYDWDSIAQKQMQVYEEMLK